MTYTTTLDQIPFDVLYKSAEYVREKYQLGRDFVITEHYEREYGVRIYRQPDDIFDYPSEMRILDFTNFMEFPSEAAYTMWLLRWS